MADNAKEALDEARQVIDGEMNCGTPEYRAADLLHQAVSHLHTSIVALVLAIEFQQDFNDLFAPNK
jgi:hypothetical protein